MYHPSISWNAYDSGWSIGEGAGAIVLKNNDKVNPSEKIYAVVDEIMNKNLSQLPLFCDKDSNIGYIELDADGFETEKEINDLLVQNPSTKTALGSIKANIGNTFAAAGIASIIKTALCVHHQFIPRIPNWQKPKVDQFEGTPFYFPTTSRPWIKKDGTVRKAVVCSGSSALKLEETAIEKKQNFDWDILQKYSAVLAPISGDSLEMLLLGIEETKKSIAENGFRKVAKECYKKLDTNHLYKVVIIAKDESAFSKDLAFFKKQLATAFEQNKVLKLPSGSYFSPNPTAKEGGLAFVYPGSATTYAGVGHNLFQFFPDLLTHFDSFLPELGTLIGADYLYPKTIKSDQKVPLIQKDAIAMMSTGVLFATIYTHILRHYFKIKPKAALGYSMGECSSMWYALKLWNYKGAQRFVDSPIFKNQFSGNLELLAKEWNISSEEAKERWISWIVLSSKETIEPIIANYDKVYLTFVNSSKEVIISGDKYQCQKALDQLNSIQTTTYIEVPFKNIIHHDFCNKEK